MNLESARQHAQTGIASLISRADGQFYAGAHAIVDSEDAILQNFEITVHTSHMLVLHVQRTIGTEYILAITLDQSTSLIHCSENERAEFNQKCINYHLPDPSIVPVVVYYSDAVSVLS